MGATNGEIVVSRSGDTAGDKDNTADPKSRATAVPARRRRGPRWVWVCAIVGVVLMLVSGGAFAAYKSLERRYVGAIATADLFGDEAAGVTPTPPTSDITGPLDILLVGIDPRNPKTPPLADSIMILHVSAGLDRAYLFSLPRDLRVDIPRFDKADFNGGTDRINAAMSYGSRVPGQELPDAARGFELLSRTISNYTGIKRFDAGAIINFNGFKKIVDAMGGVDLYIDANTKSEHLKPDGTPREGNPNGGYLGPQAEYKVGMRHLNGWQALDYVRQRKSLPNGDYDRQRHQQQFIKAMVDQALSLDVISNPLKLDSVLRAGGKSLIFNGRGRTIMDFAIALRNLRSSSIQMIKLPGQGIGTGSNYRGERLDPIADRFFAALRGGTVESFLTEHPELLNSKT